jgi:hypothetical protein
MAVVILLDIYQHLEESCRSNCCLRLYTCT